MATTADLTIIETHKLAKAVVKHLKGWKYPADNKTDRWAYLAGPDGQQIMFMGSNWAGKTGQLHIAGRYWIDNKAYNPKNYHIEIDGERVKYGEPLKDSINVTPTKDPKRIAGDITRRLLPRYSQILSSLMEGIKRENQYKDNRLAMIQRLSKIGGTVYDGQGCGSDNPELNLSISDGGAWGSFKPDGEKRLRLELHDVSVEQAEAILKLLTVKNTHRVWSVTHGLELFTGSQEACSRFIDSAENSEGLEIHKWRAVDEVWRVC